MQDVYRTESEVEQLITAIRYHQYYQWQTFAYFQDYATILVIEIGTRQLCYCWKTEPMLRKYCEKVGVNQKVQRLNGRPVEVYYIVKWIEYIDWS